MICVLYLIYRCFVIDDLPIYLLARITYLLMYTLMFALRSIQIEEETIFKIINIREISREIKSPEPMINESTTVERVIAIFGMIFGVISFTFVVSHINSFLTKKTYTQIRRERKFIFLEKLNRRYKFSDVLYKMALSQIKHNKEKDNTIENMECFLKLFPKNLKNDLEIYMYESQVNTINMFKGLPNDTIIQIGQTLTPVIYTQRNFHQIPCLSHARYRYRLLNKDK